MISKAEQGGDIHGVRATRSVPSVSHLFFADDSLIFTSATLAEGQRLKPYLLEYAQASGQRINFDKSAVIHC